MRGDISLTKELEVMAKWELDANSWYLVKLLFIAKYEEDSSYLMKYVTECNKNNSIRDTLQNLKDKKILDPKYTVPEKGEVFSIKDLKFREGFIKKYFKVSLEGGREIFDAYPKWLEREDGLLMPARNLVSKVVFKSPEAFYFEYGKSINWDLKLHEQVLKGLEFAKENKLVKSSIVEFVISKKYQDYIEAMEKDGQGLFNQKINTLTINN